MRKTKGFTLVEILIVVGVFGLILTTLVVILNSKQKNLYDTKRVSDVQALRNALEVVKNEQGSYDKALCELGFASACAQKSSSYLLQVMPDLGNLNDPAVSNVLCTSGQSCVKSGCNYTITLMEEDAYEVLFHLDKGVEGVGEKGCYRLTQEGISAY
jgi:prepilin-type N-terminal cleavage/methylation domain-containing protein